MQDCKLVRFDDHGHFELAGNATEEVFGGIFVAVRVVSVEDSNGSRRTNIGCHNVNCLPGGQGFQVNGICFDSGGQPNAGCVG